MKIEKISENKLKVTISSNDLEERDIDLYSWNYNAPATQELFIDIKEQTELLFGINIDDSQLCIEATPDSDEGFVVTITIVDGEEDFESIQKYIKNKFKKNDLRAKKKSKNIYSAIIIYSFGDFEDICTVCNKISTLYTGESTLFKLLDTYYIMMLRNGYTVSDVAMFETYLSEFGNKIQNTGFYEGYLNEYGENIIKKDALEVISRYFQSRQ